MDLSEGLMFSTRRPFDVVRVSAVPCESGVYVVYDLAGPIYVGRSRVSIRDRLMAHVTGRGNRNLTLARHVGAAGSLTFSFLSGIVSVEQAEAQLIQALGVTQFANLRKETDPADWA